MIDPRSRWDYGHRNVVPDKHFAPKGNVPMCDVDQGSQLPDSEKQLYAVDYVESLESSVAELRKELDNSKMARDNTIPLLKANVFNLRNMLHASKDRADKEAKRCSDLEDRLRKMAQDNTTCIHGLHVNIADLEFEVKRLKALCFRARVGIILALVAGSGFAVLGFLVAFSTASLIPQ